MANQVDKKNGFFSVRYVSFSSSNVSVNLNEFLNTKNGQALVKSAAKPKKKPVVAKSLEEAPLLNAM